MSEIQQLSLSELKMLIGDNEQLLSKNYLSQNLVIVRDAHISMMKAIFNGAPIILPEIRILIPKKGRASPIVNLVQRHYEEKDLVFIGRNSVLEYNGVAEELQGIGLSVSDELFSLVVGNHIPKAFDGHLRDFQLHLQSDDFVFLDNIHGLLYDYVSSPNNSPQVIVHLLSAFFWYVDALWTRQEQVSRHSLTREQKLFSDFICLVNDYAPSQHNIDFYASRLFMSPRYMSSLVKKVSGKAAKEWIDEAIITQVKIRLKYTEKSINAISDEMYFPNPSFFSKYFKRMTGQTPLEYKNSRTEGPSSIH